MAGRSTAKINQTAARAIEMGNTARPHGGWTGTWDKTLNPAVGIAYSELSLEKEFSTESDNQVTFGAQPSAEVLQSISMDNTYSFVNRFRTKDADFAWAFGFETVKPVVVAILTDPESILSVDKFDVYEIDGADYKFLRFEKCRLTDYSWSKLAVFSPVGDTVIEEPIIGSNTLESLTGDDIIVSKIERTMYEHLYELPNDRSLRLFTEAEQNAMGFTEDQKNAGWQRSLMMRVLKSFSDYVVDVEHSICESFSLNYTSGSPVQFESNMVSFNDATMPHEEVESASFELDCESRESILNINFYNTMFEIATHADQPVYKHDNNFEVGVTDINLGVSIPMQKIQDTVSGLYINEPQIEGKYEYEGSVTVTHNKGTKFRQIRDNQEYAHARVSSYRGTEMQELLIKRFRLKQAGADNGDVAAEPLEMNIAGSCGEHSFTDWLTYSDDVNPEVYESAIVMRTRNFNPKLSLVNLG